jgi:hypothetical protein
MSISQGRKPMPVRAEVLGDGTIGRQELLGVSRRLKPLHAPLPLAGGLMGVFRTVVQIAVLPMLDTGQEFPLRCAIAFELVGDDHPWYVSQALEQLPEELRGGMLVSPTLDQDIEGMAVLIHRPPEVVSLATDREEHLVEVPLVARLGAPSPELVGVLLSKFPAPLADRFIRHGDPTFE